MAKLRCVRSTWSAKTLSIYTAANIEPVGFRAVDSAWSAEVNSPGMMARIVSLGTTTEDMREEGCSSEVNSYVTENTRTSLLPSA